MAENVFTNLHVTSGFYNAEYDSVAHDYDRKYDAEQFSAIFNGLIADGVYQHYGSGMEVKPSTSQSGGISVTVGTGRAWLNSTWTYIDALETINLTPANSTLSRYTGVVLKVDKNNRKNSIVTFDGAYSNSPQKTDVTNQLVNPSGIYYYLLAYIYVGAGISTITASNITPAIGNVSGSPTWKLNWVNHVIDPSINASYYYNQWDSQYTTWLNSIKNAWNTWFANSNSTVKTAWNNWLTSCSNAWDTYLAGKDSAWEAWLTHTDSLWSSWFGDVEYDEDGRVIGGWGTKYNWSFWYQSVKDIIDGGGDTPVGLASRVATLELLNPTRIATAVSQNQATVTITNNKITASSEIDVYTDVYKVQPRDISVSDHTLTMTFSNNHQSANLIVEVYNRNGIL